MKNLKKKNFNIREQKYRERFYKEFQNVRQHTNKFKANSKMLFREFI